MGEWNDIIEIALRSVVSLVVLFLLTRLMGKKQISQLNFFDYTIGISIGSIAAEMASKTDGKFYHSLIAMTIYAGIAILISFITCKSIVLRRVLSGKSVILIDNGEILQKNMRRMKFDMDDLLTECRGQGYFSLSDLRYVILETNGKLSFLPYSQYRPATPQDLNLTPPTEGLSVNIIMDGVIMEGNLKYAGKDGVWLRKELAKQKVSSIGDVFLATCDEFNQLTVFKKTEKESKRSIFE